MSVKKWRQLAEEKSAVDKQTEEIHQKFRIDKINKEFGQLSGEELFRPITKRLDEKAATMWKKKKRRSRNFLIIQWMNLTKLTLLVMNSDRMHQHQHHHQHHHHHHHHPHIKKLLMMMMIFHHHPNR